MHLNAQECSEPSLILLGCDLRTSRFADIDILLALLSGEEREEAGRRRQAVDRRRMLVGRFILRYGLTNYFGLKEADVKRGEHGRPFLSNCPTVDFNISHSGAWILCLIGNHRRVGVDVEELRSFDLGITHRLARAEFEYWTSLEDRRKPKAFYRIWTAKESYLKARGNTFLESLDQFWFSFERGETRLVHPVAKDRTKWQFETGELNPGYVYSCCYSGKKTRLQMVRLTENHLFSLV